MRNLYDHIRHPLERFREQHPDALFFEPIGDRFSYCASHQLWLSDGIVYRRLATFGDDLRDTLTHKPHFQWVASVTVET